MPIPRIISGKTGLLGSGAALEVQPIGLGARDLLRLEAGMPLYGQEINLEIDPLEAGLGFGVDFTKDDTLGVPALRARNTAQWKEVFKEDIFVVEGMQKGRYAPMFDGGRFSPAMDGPTHMFHDWVAGRMQAWRGADKAAE